MPVFDAYSRYYNLLYKDKDYAAEAKYLDRLISRHVPGARSILDLGCGTGRHDLLLAGLGYQVTGVDLSEKMIAIAGEGLAAATLPPGAVEFREGDLRTLRLERSFDVVVSLFHVLSYQVSNADLAAAFATARAHLGAGGVFIFDCWYGPAVLTDRPVVRVKRLEEEGLSVTRIAEPVLHANRNVVDVNYQILVQDRAANEMQELVESHHMRFLFRPELELFAAAAGLELVDSFEWLTGREPGMDTWGVCFVMKGCDR